MANRARRLLIYIGRSLPFILCFLVFISYSETILSLNANKFMCFADCCIVYTPVSFFVGNIFEYDWLIVILTLVVSVAIEACVLNLTAVMYLGLQLIEKSYLSTVELYEEYIYMIAAVNIMISGLLCYKGAKKLITTK